MPETQENFETKRKIPDREKVEAPGVVKNTGPPTIDTILILLTLSWYHLDIIDIILVLSRHHLDIIKLSPALRSELFVLCVVGTMARSDLVTRHNRARAWQRGRRGTTYNAMQYYIFDICN